MYQFFVSNPVLAIIFILVVVAVVLYAVVKLLQTIGLEKVRGKVYEGFLKAEHEFKHGDNHTKFEYVVNLAKQSVPTPFNLFITEDLLRKVIQLWFDLVKDLLDDGKLNGTQEEE